LMFFLTLRWRVSALEGCAIFFMLRGFALQSTSA
jgi:hypothetical protein